jgi:endonuclease YncB( thermonuclease family)
MQNVRTLLAGTVAVLQLVQPSTRTTDPVLVRAVIDGDTIDAANYGRVRLLGIDAPELAHGYDTAAPFAREAKERLAALVLHRWVRLQEEGDRFDVYRRHLAYVLTEDGVFVNATLVREGLARVTARVVLSRMPELQRAEAEAQAFRRGMWGSTPQLPPTAGYTRPAGPRNSPEVRIKKPRAPRAAAARTKKKKHT